MEQHICVISPISTISEYHCATCGVRANSSDETPNDWRSLAFVNTKPLFFCPKKVCVDEYMTLLDENTRRKWLISHPSYTGKVDFTTYQCNGCNAEKKRCIAPPSHSINVGGGDPWQGWGRVILHEGGRLEFFFYCPKCVEKMLAAVSLPTA